MTCGVCKYEWCWVCSGDHFLPHCNNPGHGRVTRPSPIPQTFISDLDWIQWAFLAVGIPIGVAAIPMVLMATFVIFTTSSCLKKIFEETRSCHLRCCLLPYVVMVGCIAFVLNFYLIICDLTAAPCFLIKECLIFYKDDLRSWQNHRERFRL